MRVEQLAARHPYHQEHQILWDRVKCLYKGGFEIMRRAAEFLVKRPMEPQQQYQARLERFTYQNILGTALGWYASRMFKEEIQLFFRSGDQPVADEYLARFQRDADRRGTSLGELVRQWFVTSVLYGGCYVLIDLPPVEGQPRSRHDQRAAGMLDAYVVTYEPQQIINWSCDSYGNFDWVVIETSESRSAMGGQTRIVDRWLVLDRESYQIWEADREKQRQDRAATLVREGRHALANERRVPLHRICLPDGLWLAYRVYPQIVDHLNQDNSLGWALFIANLAVPVVTGAYEHPPKVSETAVIVLEQGSTFTWAEPSGHSFAMSAERLSYLGEEIHRQMYLLAQARSSSATASAQSGISKQQDMAPSTDVLNGYGAIFRAAVKSIVEDIGRIRDLALTVECQGLSFPERDALDEIETANAALEMDIPSETYRRQVQKRVARQYLGNADPDTLKTIDSEIDAAPSAQQRRRDQFAFPGDQGGS